MKMRHIAVLTALSAIPLASQSVTAQPEDVVIVSPPTLAIWSERVFADISRKIKYPEPLANLPVSTGVVAVKFNCSESGAPAGIELSKSSGYRDLDRATLKAVAKVATLHPLPTGLNHDQVYVVRVLFSNSAADRNAQIKKMTEEAARSNSWFSKRSSVAGVLELAPAES